MVRKWYYTNISLEMVYNNQWKNTVFGQAFILYLSSSRPCLTQELWKTWRIPEEQKLIKGITNSVYYERLFIILKSRATLLSDFINMMIIYRKGHQIYTRKNKNYYSLLT